MAKRGLNLQSNIISDFIKLNEDEQDFSKISSESDEETVLLGNVAGTSGSVRTDTHGTHDLQSQSSSASD
jgi:hypothetical protein